MSNENNKQERIKTMSNENNKKDIIMSYTLKNIEMKGHEHGQLSPDIIYAKLYDKNNKLIIAATLEYILCAIRDRQLPTKNVSVAWKETRGANCSTIKIEQIDG